ncbi:MAG: phosphoenolpyruvate carboxykinase [Bacteroides sp.]|nr:hypothetical protein [Roseburia sp.]MCM1346003.1 phosphoenolpyruvate carboxykinase [Bacteroides sp.]MCM1420838.1 phosphoenolpyruvate carboxykinase [Bacteroides sp.]
MNKTDHYRIADFVFRISSGEDIHIHNLLPSFSSFECGCVPDDDCLFCCRISHGAFDGLPSSFRLIEESSNNMNFIRLWKHTDGYVVESSLLTDDESRLYMYADSYCSDIHIVIVGTGICSGIALGNLLRIAYSQAIIRHGAVSLHASTVCLDGKAYIFMGKSGTGKSTHSRLWQRCFDSCELLNDDNPVVRMENGIAVVYGTPWSGKTACYKNKSCAVGGFVRIRQNVGNRFIPCEGVTAFAALLPGCVVIKEDGGAYDAMCDTLTGIATTVRVGILECLPDEAAAELCRKSLDMSRAGE